MVYERTWTWLGRLWWMLVAVLLLALAVGAVWGALQVGV